MIKISEVNFNEASCVSHYSPRKFLIRVSAECNNGKKTEGKGYIYIETISDLRFMISRGKGRLRRFTKACEAVEIINALHVREFASPR